MISYEVVVFFSVSVAVPWLSKNAVPGMFFVPVLLRLNLSLARLCKEASWVL